jgi:ABC-type lipoprotein release transport system permease subunit
MTIQKFDSGMHYVLIPDDVLQPFLEKGVKRAIATIQNHDFHCAFMAKKEGGYFINIGSKICKALNLKLGDEIEVSFKEDSTEYQFEMPEEFIEVLYQEEEA